LFGTILGSLIMAGILKVVADGILSAELGFKRILAAVAYGGLPNILKILLAAVVMQYKPPDEFDLNNPLVFHLGALLSNDTPLWLQTLGGSFELFTFWSMFLTAMGLGSVSKKMRTGKAFGMILFLWAAAVILSVGWVAISGTAR
jgi:alpha-D-ribose 1-methylphosphonate 5-triphosphate synthase subunit PhnH